MYNTQKQWAVAIVSVIVVGVVVFLMQNKKEVTVAPDTAEQEARVQEEQSRKEQGGETEVVVQTKPVKAFTFPIHTQDSIKNWSFIGSYTGNDVLIAKAVADTTFLKNLVGKGEYSDYDLYIGIANNNAFLGDGARAYEYYNKAISENRARAIAYLNLGNLMEKLGALHTAYDAYTRASTLEPDIAQYSSARNDFLSRHPEFIAS